MFYDFQCFKSHNERAFQSIMCRCGNQQLHNSLLVNVLVNVIHAKFSLSQIPANFLILLPPQEELKF